MASSTNFYKFSFWLKDILTNDRAFVYIKADTDDDAVNKFNTKYGHYKMRFIEMKKVTKRSQEYRTLCSLNFD